MRNRLPEHISSVAVGGHIRPDGDCVGSCMALYQYLRNLCPQAEVDVYLEEIPDCFRFLQGTDRIRHTVSKGKTYDLFIALDCGDKERLGFSLPLFTEAKHTFCVDHHISNKGFAQENYIMPEASSTSELLYDLMEKERITEGIAEALYLGIVHDTGVFQYSCASPSTFRAAAALLEKGVDAPGIIRSTYYEKSYARNQILGRALLESILFMDGRCIASYVTKSMMKFYGIAPKDLDGIVTQLLMTRGVEAAVFMYETEPNLYKVSLRSKERIDVNRIAGFFGGGGHVRAAGFSFAGTPFDVLNNLIRQMEIQFQELEKET